MDDRRRARARTRRSRATAWSRGWRAAAPGRVATPSRILPRRIRPVSEPPAAARRSRRGAVTAPFRKALAALAAPRAWQGDAGRVSLRWLEECDGDRRPADRIAPRLSGLPRRDVRRPVLGARTVHEFLLPPAAGPARCPERAGADAVPRPCGPDRRRASGRAGAAGGDVGRGGAHRPRALACRTRRGNDLPLRRRHRPARLCGASPAGTRGARVGP
jgi:hypothetical protein